MKDTPSTPEFLTSEQIVALEAQLLSHDVIEAFSQSRQALSSDSREKLRVSMDARQRLRDDYMSKTYAWPNGSSEEQGKRVREQVLNNSDSILHPIFSGPGITWDDQKDEGELQFAQSL